MRPVWCSRIILLSVSTRPVWCSRIFVSQYEACLHLKPCPCFQYFSTPHIHTFQNSPPTPPFEEFHVVKTARGKLPRGSYSGPASQHQRQGPSYKVQEAGKKGQFNPPVRPPTGSLVATINLLAQKEQEHGKKRQPSLQGFNPPVRPPTGSLVATINRLAKRTS